MSSNQILLEAIALKKCVTTQYNGVTMLLAPHILYTKNEALFIDAITVEKHGQPPREKKIGAFHLQGMRELAITDLSFEADELFDPSAGKYDGVALFKVDAA